MSTGHRPNDRNMAKRYTSNTVKRDARPRSGRLRGIAGPVRTAQSSGVASADSHTHANKADLDAFSTDSEGYGLISRQVTVPGETEGEWNESTVIRRINAGYADSAYDLSPDSPLLAGLRSLIVPVDSSGNELDYTQSGRAVALKAKLGLFSDGDIVALGPDGSGGSGGGGTSYDRLDAWADYSASKSGYVLSAMLGYDLHTRVNDVASGVSSLAARVAILEEGGGSFDESVLSDYLKKSDAQRLYQPKGDYLTEHQSLAGYVTLGTPQTITGIKTFSGEHRFAAHGVAYSDPWPSVACAVKVAGKVGVTDSVRAMSFIKSGGTALQLLMADGSVRSLKTRTSVGPSDWTDQVSADALVPTMSVLAFWNGRYNASSSNLQYCDRGRFGDIVTQSLSSLDSRYVNASGDTMTGTLFLGGRTGQVGSDSAKAWLQWQGSVLSVNAQGAWFGGTGKVWHSDNDGSGSGLDADMLDGVHKNGFSSRKYLGFSSDSKVCYIILTHAYNGSVIGGSSFHGMVAINRGSSNSWNGKTAVYIALGGQYNSNVSSYFKLGSSVNVSGIYRVIYNGTAYLALRMEAVSSQEVVIHGEISDYSVPCIVQESQVSSPTLINNAPGLDANAVSATRLASSRSIWGQGFDGTGNVSGNMTGVGNINTAASPAGTIYVNNWLRTVGNCGWYSETYGGGWFMSDSTWIRNHNNKSLYMSTAVIRTDGQIQVGGNGDKFLVTSAGAVTAASSIVSKADVIGLSTSDERLKHNICPVRDAVVRLRELGGFFSFDYNPDASEKDKVGRIGLIYQRVHGPLAGRMRHLRDDGHGALNYIHPDYINLIGAGVLEVAHEVEDLRAELSSLKKRVHRLENTSYMDPTYY